jgi:hypothetical protein
MVRIEGCGGEWTGKPSTCSSFERIVEEDCCGGSDGAMRDELPSDGDWKWIVVEMSNDDEESRGEEEGNVCVSEEGG